MATYFSSVFKALPFDQIPHNPTLLYRIPRSITSVPFVFNTQSVISPFSYLSLVSTFLSQNLAILIVLLFISTYFGIFSASSKRLSKNPEYVIYSEAEDSPISSACVSPNVCGLTEASLIPEIGLTVLYSLVVNGNFEKYFEVKGPTWQEGNKKVYLTQHKLDGHFYLVKNRDFETDFGKTELAVLDEVSKYRRLNCRNVSRYVTCWVELASGKVSLYIQMEKVEGVSLKDYIKNGVSSDDAVKVLRKLAKGLLSVHLKGVVHGNLSIESVYIDKYEKLTIDKFEFTGFQEQDLTKFIEIYQKVLNSVYKDSVCRAEEKILSDKFVRKLKIYSKLKYLDR